MSGLTAARSGRSSMATASAYSRIAARCRKGRELVRGLVHRATVESDHTIPVQQLSSVGGYEYTF